MFGNIHVQYDFFEDCILFPRFSSFYTRCTFTLRSTLDHYIFNLYLKHNKLQFLCFRHTTL